LLIGLPINSQNQSFAGLLPCFFPFSFQERKNTPAASLLGWRQGLILAWGMWLV